VLAASIAGGAPGRGDFLRQAVRRKTDLSGPSVCSTGPAATDVIAQWIS
jgi:hypothetical protein